VGSALSQDIEDLEVLVVGDGCPDATRDLMADVMARDRRVQFFDRPKGERLGEAQRHAALAQASGTVIAYLADDDLWHRSHLSSLLPLLADADVAHTLPVGVRPDGSLHVWTIDLALPGDRRLIMELENRIPVSFFAHTADFYRRMPRGWHPGPKSIPSDLHFYRHALGIDGCRAVSGMAATGVHFPSPDRPGWTPARRLGELKDWSGRLRSEWPIVLRGVLEAVARDRADLEMRYRHEVATLRDELYRMSSYVDYSRGAVLRADAAAAEATQRESAAIVEVDALRRELTEGHEATARLREELTGMRSTATWRLHDRLIDHRAAGFVRRVVRRLAGPSS
jgi:glycosyltransferase involved in cell wall biosynthesis